MQATYCHGGAVLLDFGGVLVEEGFREGLKAITSQQGLDSREIFERGMDAAYDSGYALGSGKESDFWDLLHQRTGIRGDDSTLRVEILSRFVVRAWLLAIAQSLRQKGYVVGILSDQCQWLEELDASQHFLGEFDRVFVSYKLA